MGGKRRRSAAFTLIETMVVVAIFGVLAALAAPRISSIVRERSASLAYSSFAAELRRARDVARAQARCVHVTNPTSSTLQREVLPVLSDGTCDTTPLTTETVALNGRVMQLSAVDLTFGRTGALVGVTASWEDVPVQLLSDSGTKTRTVRVFRELGLVRELR